MFYNDPSNKSPYGGIFAPLNCFIIKQVLHSSWPRAMKRIDMAARRRSARPAPVNAVAHFLYAHPLGGDCLFAVKRHHFQLMKEF